MPRKKNLRAIDPSLTPDALKVWRVSKNLTDPRWSQGYAADFLGVSERMYRRWENGEYPIPLYISLRIFEHETMMQRIESLQTRLTHAERAPM